MSRRVLMIAYHYPPVLGSSGVHRSLKFSQYLPELGWDVSVLTVHPRAYERTATAQLKDIPASVEVVPAFALDCARHLSIKGRYWSALALPDRYSSWLLGGLWSGLRLIARQKPAFIYSTYPIATAHLIGYCLHKLSGLPWVADFRDPMAQDGYPSDPKKWRSYQRIEALALRHATRCLFTTPGTVAFYRERYPEVNADKFVLIGNGFDEEDFAKASPAPRAANEPLLVLHSGVIYPSERDPRPFFEALAELKQQGRIDATGLRVRLRATGHDHLYRPQLEALGIADLVELAPASDYRSALSEMLSADALLLFQAANCNQQIPAKAYEYLRAGRPVFALTDAAGDTAALLHSAGLHAQAPLDERDSIVTAFGAFLERLARGEERGAERDQIAQHSRRARSQQLAALLDKLQP